MKQKLPFSHLAMLSILVLLTFRAFAQVPPPPPVYNPLQDVNAQLRSLFTPLYRPPLPVQQYLYDMSAHVTDDKYWTNISYDSSTTDNWFRLYWEHFYMAYDTTVLPRDEDIYEAGQQYRGDTVPLGIMDVSYYQLVNKALQSNIYFNFDTIIDVLTDVPNRPMEPYFIKNIFTVAPLYNQAKYAKVTWVIGGALFTDIVNSPFYNPAMYRFEVDFGDGTGFHFIDPTTTTYTTIDYGALGLKDNIYLNARITQDGQLKKHSRSTFLLGKRQATVRPYDEVLYYDEMPVVVYRACNSEPKNRRVVIYLEGIDILDFLPKQNRTAEDMYYSMLQIPNISQLANFGYDFYIVDWANSRVDMRSNAMRVVNMIDKLKKEVENDYEFVIIGESMGGVIARYALTFMESPGYTDPRNWPYANRRERMHNCRLMITLDSPHQGANVPLSLQHMYDVSAKALGGALFGMPMATRIITKYFNLFLDARATQQLLIYHIDTKNGWGLYQNYTEHKERTSFMNDLKMMGDYPQFCKKMAVSNGALDGEMQTRFYSFTDRVANDRLLDFHTELFAKILWFIKVPIFGADMELRTNPAGAGQVFQLNVGAWGIRLKFYWFGVRLITGYNSLVNVSEFADVQPYCVNAGGYFQTGLEEVVGKSTGGGTNFNVSRYWILNVASFRSGSDGSGCWGSKAHVGFEGFASANFDLSICSDGMHFGFIPVQSALDYGKLTAVPLDYDFESDLQATPAIINSNTPFDVIVANGRKDDYFLGKHSLNQSHLYVKYEGLDWFLKLKFPYRDCSSNIFGHWINREIGDEIVYFDNYDCSRSSIYEAEYGTYINTFDNPWYVYANGLGGGMQPGFYSKANDFAIRDNVNADFRYDFGTHNPPWTINYIFNPASYQGSSPFNGTWTTNQSNFISCFSCIDYGKKGREPAKKPDINSAVTSFAKVYPNPNTTGTVYVDYSFRENLPVKIIVTDVLGKTVYSKNFSSTNNTQQVSTAIRLDEYQFSKGLYIISISNGNESFVNKLIVE